MVSLASAPHMQKNANSPNCSLKKWKEFIDVSTIGIHYHTSDAQQAFSGIYLAPKGDIS